jgi:transcriptional regulator with XRE-family HTH domain
MIRKPQKYPNTLRVYRKKTGLRQHEVARLLGLDGSTERISKWENGSAVPHLANVFKLAVLYKVSPQELYPEMWQAIEHPTSSSTVEAPSEAGIPVEV